MAADQGIIDSVSTDNIKTVAGQGAWALAARQQDHVGHARFMDGLREKLLSDTILGKVSVADAVGTSQLLKADASNSLLANLDQLSGAQIGQKTANTTPPETGMDLAQLSAQIATVLALLQAQSNGPSPVATPVTKA